MGQYPTSPRSEVLSFAQVHNGVWKGIEAAVGLTVAQRTAVENAAVAMTTALENQAVAKTAAENATRTANESFRELKLALSEAVRSIKTFAENSANPTAVYEEAQIAPPAPPSPVGPPAQPSDIRVSLNTTTGALTLTWKASNPRSSGGTAYIVRRRLPGENTFAFIGVTGEKSYTDDTFNAGPDSVEYTIQGQRAGVSGPVSAIVTITFGRAGNGQASVSGVRLAA